ncbi:hypothetical protein G6514_000299 [Epicoccum nigrum]|nr:hypothetical protein G6514_000299 [Epicoccum nigrum]
MPSRKEENQLIAREKALNTRVYVSGLRGDHNLETGLAYYYRGHYLYSFPGGALIEPIPYSTKKGIMVHGMVSPSAPTYDGSSARLVPEGSIRALEAGIKNELGPRESPPALGQAGEGVDVGASGGYTDLLLRILSPSLLAPSAAAPLPSPARVSALRHDADSALTLPLIPSSIFPPSSPIWAPASSPSVSSFPPSAPALSLSVPIPSLSVPAPSHPTSTLTYTPQAGATFLAASAPGSRFTSPLPSPSSRGTMSGSQRLSALRGEQSRTPTPAHRSSSAVPTSSHRPPSAIDYHGRSEIILLRPPEMQRATAAASGTKSKPCSLHRELCDGVTTMWDQETEALRRRRGFVEPTPLVVRGARVMVDWAQLLKEARAEQGQHGQSDEEVD